MIKKLFLFLFIGAAGLAFNSSAEECLKPQAKNFIKYCVKNSAENSFDPNMEGSGFNWEFKGTYQVIYADQKIFSCFIEELSYTGGAHGNFQVTVCSMYRKSGKKITVKDIAPTTQQRKKLLDLVTSAVAKKFKCSQQELPKKLLHLPFLTENFYLDKSGITFVFNEYEIASKGAGPVKAAVSFKEYQFSADPENKK